ncbi:CDF family Co(II)/Ni(II) efflux transporter DmeF [Variovorax terrae]|uniref:CDF family Co(II)/Ni(II) efflux transporter DmeF n=1 Tax=Variovorax terrae TaxID=2923278 RepID=A0A9X1VVJ7_9BURK|nr:CDF family Co(II)/Ni(II) efflux transporter DmeF [Variovorax terrae]MCJ0763755.1 CDF family Co(II)/Ni(II) efflux transporter DmeF [Variovorax terrae]
MHVEHLNDWTHDHAFHSASESAERGTRAVMWITLVAMVVEITAGWWFNSMALLADGWHMSSHAVAIGLSAFAYAAARRYARDPRFAFGTWKIEILGGFASAILLLGVAALMVVASLERLLQPQPVHYLEAMVVAVAGLLVNLVCAGVLSGSHAKGHDHHHGHAHDHHHGHGHDDAPHEDLNLKSAYLHVLADAATSVLAIAALAGGWWLGWTWLDPAMGIAGAVLVTLWAWGLMRQTGRVLLDREMDHPVVAEIREALEFPGDPHETRIADLHVWRVGRNAYACALTLVTHDPQLTPDRVRQQLAIHPEIAHTTVEIHWCEPASPHPALQAH